MKKLSRCLLSTLVAAMFLVFSTGAVQAGKCELPEFDVANFGSPADNPYLSQSVIGKTYVYEAEDEDGLIRNYIQFTTDNYAILGVTCTVVYDVEWIWVEELNQWFKLEETYDWHAWDNFGNFWYFGEDTVEFIYDDDWNPVPPFTSTEGSWEARQDVAGVGSDAEAGIILPAAPEPGDCNKQEYYEDEAEDVGKVLRLNAKCEDPDGNDSEECMVMKEWTGLEPGNVEHKIYLPTVVNGYGGLMHIKELKEKTVEVELVDINSNTPPDPPPDSPTP